MNNNEKLLEIGNRIKELRLKNGMSQETLALKVGYKSRTSINKIELGKTDLSQSIITKIANELYTTPAYLMGWETEDEANSSQITEAQISDKELKFALFGGGEITDNVLQEVKNFAQYVKEREKNKKELEKKKEDD